MKFVAKAQESRERDANMMMRGFVKIQTAKVLCLRLQCLERIRADVLKFTTGTEGQVNKMRDDLISRKEAIDILENMIFEVGKDLSKSHLLQDARKRIIGLNTAFDKEKVIEELDKLTGEDCTLHECGIRSERCKPCIAKKAVEIVKRGGLI